MKAAAVLLIAFFLCSTISYSQVVNVEKLRKVTDTTGFAGGMIINGFYLNQGSRIINIKIAPNIQYKTRKDLFLLYGLYYLVKSDDVNFRNSGLLHFRYNRKLNKWLRLEAFTQIQEDKVSNLRYRYLVGLGPRVKCLEKPRFNLYVGSLPMLELEESVEPASEFRREFRLSSYLSFTMKISDGLSWHSTSYYQPRFDKFSDYRIFFENQLSVDVWSFMDFVVSAGYTYDKFPPLDAPQDFFRLGWGLTFEF